MSSFSLLKVQLCCFKKKFDTALSPKIGKIMFLSSSLKFYILRRELFLKYLDFELRGNS